MEKTYKFNEQFDEAPVLLVPFIVLKLAEASGQNVIENGFMFEINAEIPIDPFQIPVPRCERIATRVLFDSTNVLLTFT